MPSTYVLVISPVEAILQTSQATSQENKIGSRCPGSIGTITRSKASTNNEDGRGREGDLGLTYTVGTRDTSEEATTVGMYRVLATDSAWEWELKTLGTDWLGFDLLLSICRLP